MATHDYQTRKDYADLICTLLICNHYNPDSNKALKHCLKLFGKRITSPQVKQICKIVVKSKQTTPLKWLAEKVAEIEYNLDVPTFLNYAFNAERG